MAGDGASIGSVYVDILPNVDGSFWTRTQAQLTPGAERLGTDLGKSVGDRIAAGIKVGIGAGFSGSPGREQGRRTADDFAGEFDRIVRTRLAAALKALPKAEIGAATNEAEQKIRDLRVRLEELSNKRVGVDIDEAAAFEEIRALRDELARLARESPSVRVTADTARASAELEALRLQIDRIKSSGGVQVNASTGGSSGDVDRLGQAARDSAGGMSTLLAAGIALGPGIIPVAAAVTAAIAGIGAGALGVVGGRTRRKTRRPSPAGRRRSRRRPTRSVPRRAPSPRPSPTPPTRSAALPNPSATRSSPSPTRNARPGRRNST
jgi:hypothetical protein